MVSTPIGIGRHVRMQISSGAEDWRHYASFQDQDRARECLQNVLAAGTRARLVFYDRCPVAS